MDHPSRFDLNRRQLLGGAISLGISTAIPITGWASPDGELIALLNRGGGVLAPMNPEAKNVWSDTARTKLASRAGSRVGSIRILTSRGEQFAKAASVDSRPVLVRMPVTGVRNLLKDSAMTKASAGSPGVLPVHWGFASGGSMDVKVVQVGTADGAEFVDLRVTGAPERSGIIHVADLTQIPARSGKRYTISVTTRVVGGSTENLASIKPRIQWRNDTMEVGEVNASDNIKTDESIKRQTLSGVAPRSAKYIVPQIRFICSGEIDVTIRVSAPQVEIGSKATVWQRVAASGNDVSETGVANQWSVLPVGNTSSLQWQSPDLDGDLTIGRATMNGVEVFNTETTDGMVELLGPKIESLTGWAAIKGPLTRDETKILETFLKKNSR